MARRRSSGSGCWGCLVAIGVVLLLIAGAAAGYVFVLKKEVATADTAAQQTRLAAPETLGGRPKITDAQLTAAMDLVKANLNKEVPTAKGMVAGAYGDPAKGDLVVIIGMNVAVVNQTAELAAAMTGSDGKPLTGIVGVEPGPLGGLAKCGLDATSTPKVATCGWADSGSIGLIMWFGKTIAEAQPQFVDLRGKIESRS